MDHIAPVLRELVSHDKRLHMPWEFVRPLHIPSTPLSAPADQKHIPGVLSDMDHLLEGSKYWSKSGDHVVCLHSFFSWSLVTLSPSSPTNIEVCELSQDSRWIFYWGVRGQIFRMWSLKLSTQTRLVFQAMWPWSTLRSRRIISQMEGLFFWWCSAGSYIYYVHTDGPSWSKVMG